MGTDLNPEEMKAFVRGHFEDFVNNQRAEVIRENMAPDFLDHNGPGDREVGIVEDEQMVLGDVREDAGHQGDDRRHGGRGRQGRELRAAFRSLR